MFSTMKVISSLAAAAAIASQCAIASSATGTCKDKQSSETSVVKTTLIVQPGATSKLHPRVGLALGGGGARGAAHIGVIKALEKEGIPIDYITGTSIGSVIGGLYAAGVPIETIERDAKNNKILKAFNPIPIPVRCALVPFTTLPRLIGIHHYVGLYRGTKFARFLYNTLPDGRKNIEDAKIPFEAVATDLQTGQPYVLKSGPMNKAMQASAAIPWLRKPVIIDGHKLCDGFLGGDNLPIREARQMGADVVICSDIDGPLTRDTDKQLHHIRPFENRTLTILLSKLDEHALKEPDVLLTPYVAHMGVLSGKQKDIDDAIAQGEKVTMEAMPLIRKVTHLPANSRMAATPAAKPM